jgi:hypothetical protein
MMKKVKKNKIKEQEEKREKGKRWRRIKCSSQLKIRQCKIRRLKGRMRSRKRKVENEVK